MVMRAVTWRECWRGRWRGPWRGSGTQEVSLEMAWWCCSDRRGPPRVERWFPAPLCSPPAPHSAGRRHAGCSCLATAQSTLGDILGIDTRVQESRSISGKKSPTFRWSLMLAEHKNWSCGLELPQSSITPFQLVEL